MGTLKKILIGYLLTVPYVALSQTSTVTAAICQPILAVKLPFRDGKLVTATKCYEDAKATLKDDKQNPGNLDAYLTKVKGKKEHQPCADFLSTVYQKTTSADLKDDDIFGDYSKDKGESRATLDESQYFYNECETLKKDSKSPALPDAPATPASQAK